MGFVPDSTPGRITPGKSLEPAGTTPQPQRDFQQYMQGSQGAGKGQVPPSSEGPTPMGLSQGGPTAPGSPPSMEAILNQSKAAQDSLGTVGKQLKTPNLTLKRSQSRLLKNKLSDAHEYLRDAAAKAGVQTPPMTTPPGGGPIDRFMAYVNDGQDQLIQVQQQLQEMSKKGHQLSPTEMLSITVKMNLAQQEIEYSSTLLAKVIDSIKQILNTQL